MGFGAGEKDVWILADIFLDGGLAEIILHLIYVYVVIIDVVVFVRFVFE